MGRDIFFEELYSDRPRRWAEVLFSCGWLESALSERYPRRRTTR